MKHNQLLPVLLILFCQGIYAAENSADNNGDNGVTAVPESEQAPAQVEEGEVESEVIDEALDRPMDESITQPADDTISEALDENFIPSEQITEDLPVAFPIDI